MTLSRAQVDALRTLRKAYPEAPIAIIGAAALGFHLSVLWRTTADIDLVLAISVPELQDVVSKFPGWRQDPKQEQRWYAPNKVSVDLVPATAELLEKGQIIWPKTGHVMKLGGIRLALAAPSLEIDDGLSIGVPSVEVIALLKMAAYLDRPSEREKDLGDLAHILHAYPPNDDDRLYADEVFALELNDRQVRGHILGRELRSIVDDVDSKIVNLFLETASTGRALSRFASLSPWSRADDPEDELSQRLDALKRAFLDDSREPSAAIVTVPGASAMPLRFVVNGEEKLIKVDPAEPLSNGVKIALARTNNTGRPPEEWELRREDGTSIPDLSRSAKDCDLAPGALLYLTLKVGAGGHASRSCR